MVNYYKKLCGSKNKLKNLIDGKSCINILLAQSTESLLKNQNDLHFVKFFIFLSLNHLT